MDISMSNDEEAKKEKDIKIIVNGTEHVVTEDVVSFDEVVEIAFPGHPNNPDIVFSVTFEKADSKPHQGTLASGGKVTVKKRGTVFDVTQTNRS
jgi:5,10-methylene-tetrahydrofolate dehydrogenase/methenyl tetrahydrofolate cyclohydrolase